MARFDPFYLPPIWTVPDDEIHIISWFGMRPDNGRMGFFSKIATPGPHIIVPGAKLVGAYSTNQFPVYLFRHDTPTPGDYAELELPDITLTAKVSIIAQLKGNGLRQKASSVFNAHYNAEDQDVLQATERILNPYIRLVLQRHSYTEYTNQRADGKTLNEIQVSKITPDQLLQALGLKQFGARIDKDTGVAEEDIRKIGETILDKLDNIGVDLMSINIDDLSLPDTVNEARNRSAVEKAEQQAALDREIARARVIEQQVENRVKEAQGLLKAVKALSENKTISDEQAYRALVEIPALKEIVGDKDKFITEGGLSGLLAMLQSK
jgi:citrate lyase gamma subunit